MARRVWLGIVGALAVVAFVFAGSAQEREVTLRFKFSPKQIRIYEHQFSGESTMTMQPPGQQEVSFTSKVQGKLTQRERIDEVDKEGKAAVTMTVSGDLRFEMSGLPGGPEPPPEMNLEPLSLRFKIDPLGKVSELTLDPSEFRDRPPVPAPASLLQMHGTSWQGLALPEKPVKVGDSWDVSLKVEVKVEDRKVEVEIKGKAKLVGFEKVDERECAVIEVNANLPDTGKIIPQLVPPEMRENISAKFEGQTASKFWLDVANGLVVKAETKGNIKISMTFKTPTGESFSMSSKGTFKTEQKLTKVEREK
ncbi:MAG: hypothetical protein N3B10_12930 [Armatimonadetes bacterium]|nr:hypothetical protein [Armatimonadota bacterium]